MKTAMQVRGRFLLCIPSGVPLDGVLLSGVVVLCILRVLISVEQKSKQISILEKDFLFLSSCRCCFFCFFCTSPDYYCYYCLKSVAGLLPEPEPEPAVPSPLPIRCPTR